MIQSYLGIKPAKEKEAEKEVPFSEFLRNFNQGA